MAYTVKKLDNLPVIVNRIHADFDMETEQASAHQEIGKLLNEAKEPHYYIVDLSQTHLSLQDIITGTNTGARKQGSSWKHPMMREIVFVSPEPAVQAAIRGLNSEVYGYLEAECFDTFDEAVAYCEAQV